MPKQHRISGYKCFPIRRRILNIIPFLTRLQCIKQTFLRYLAYFKTAYIIHYHTFIIKNMAQQNSVI